MTLIATISSAAADGRWEYTKPEPVKGPMVPLIVVNHSRGMLNQVEAGPRGTPSYVENWVPVGEEALLPAAQGTFHVAIIGANNSYLFKEDVKVTGPMMFEVVRGGKVVVTNLTAADVAKHQKATKQHEATLAKGRAAQAKADAAAAKARGPLVGQLIVENDGGSCGPAGTAITFDALFADGSSVEEMDVGAIRLYKHQLPAKLTITLDPTGKSRVLKVLRVTKPETVTINPGCQVWVH